MSGTDRSFQDNDPNDEDDRQTANGHVQNGHVNGGPVSDDDIRVMLAQEKANSQRLKRELDAERTGRNRAEQTASTQINARFDAEEVAVAARLESADTAAAGLKRDLSLAHAEGRYDDAADIQDKLAELRAKQSQDKQYKTWLEGEKQRASQIQQQPRQQQQQDDVVDLSQYSTAQRKWIRAHPEFMDDPRVRQKTFAGHSLAMAEGVEVDSPEYFQIIDEVVSRGQRTDPDPDADPPPRRRAPPAEIPVSRSQPRQQERQREIKLTADEMEAADITNPEIPVQGHRDAQGNWVPGRYERYAVQRQKLRARGQV